MSRVRIVGGTIEDLVGKLNDQLSTPLSQDEIAELRREQALLNRSAGTLSDPAGMLADALGRFNEVPEEKAARARQWCKGRKVESVDEQGNKVVEYEGGIIEDGRFTVPSEPDLDIVIVIHPDPEVIRGVGDEEILVDRYLVFGRRQEPVKGTCYQCNNMERRGQAAKPHAGCWRKRSWLEWTPFIGTWAHGLDDAEDLAKELRASWEATAEQKYGDNNRNWSAEYEIPFSGDWQAGYLAGRGDTAWSSLGQ